MQSASTGPSNPNSDSGICPGTGRFMLRLCALAAPVTLRPPQAPRLKPFTFFMDRTREPEGREQLYLYMGFFDTLAEAERWAESVRRHYPEACATLAPLGLAWSARSEVPNGYWAKSDDAHLTDTQVMEMLDAGHAAAGPGAAGASDDDQIELLRPEDTGVRKALKEAVIQGAPVSFAVQLLWATQPIDLDHVRSLDAFRGHTLYATESHRGGRSSYFLRVGFFSDPRSAKELAVQVRSTFASAAVIPVLEPEIMRAREAAAGNPAIPVLVERREEVIEFGPYETDEPARQSGSSGRAQARAAGGQRSRTRGASTESDPLSDSGVRHLKVEMQDESSGRWKVIKLREALATLHSD
ncbi:MAG: hypothetical protein JOY77_12775 [Alphaproteobacteria bacterium]|nr:hypothetical protein [Alphaproteobacteria bacterium]